MRLVSDPISPWSLLDGAAAVYTVSSQMGFEAILAGHRPQVFGRPFYAGWGLTAASARAAAPENATRFEDGILRSRGLGAGEIAGNLALLARARADNPGAVILYKPHPDVEAGLRPCAVPAQALRGLTDRMVAGVDPAALLPLVAEVWTMTSALGFEALLRRVSVTTTGAPFYAGWGLTRDLGPVPARRQARPGLAGLVHATLIDYPRYRDPVTVLPCPCEVVADRLASAVPPRAGPLNRILAKAQGALAGHARLWR